MPITDLKLRPLKPATAPFRQSDGGGLFIEVPLGSFRLWRLASWREFDVKRVIVLNRWLLASFPCMRSKRSWWAMTPSISQTWLRRFGQLPRRAETASLRTSAGWTSQIVRYSNLMTCFLYSRMRGQARSTTARRTCSRMTRNYRSIARQRLAQMRSASLKASEGDR